MTATCDLILRIIFCLHYNIEFKVLYGMEQTLYCGDSLPGEWYHDGEKLGVYSRSYTISNANFDDDGEYQCRRNGKNVLPSSFKVYVYGKS